MRIKSQTGFTLVEVLISLGIGTLAVFAALSAISISSKQEQVAKQGDQVRAIESAIQLALNDKRWCQESLAGVELEKTSDAEPKEVSLVLPDIEGVEGPLMAQTGALYGDYTFKKVHLSLLSRFDSSKYLGEISILLERKKRKKSEAVVPGAPIIAKKQLLNLTTEPSEIDDHVRVLSCLANHNARIPEVREPSFAIKYNLDRAQINKNIAEIRKKRGEGRTNIAERMKTLRGERDRVVEEYEKEAKELAKDADREYNGLIQNKNALLKRKYNIEVALLYATGEHKELLEQRLRHVKFQLAEVSEQIKQAELEYDEKLAEIVAKAEEKLLENDRKKKEVTDDLEEIEVSYLRSLSEVRVKDEERIEKIKRVLAGEKVEVDGKVVRP